MAVKHPVSNQEIARLLRYVAAVYVVEGEDQFRIRAYDAAANIIEQLSSPLYELWESGKLDEVPGLGEKLRGYMDELFTTGQVKHFGRELAREPAGMFPLVDLPGVGPKTAAKLAKAFKLKDEQTALIKLKQHAQAGDIAKLEGFTEVTERNILDALSKTRPQHDQRMLLYHALHIADQILEYLRRSPAVFESEALGSLRRRLPTVGDIDLAVATHRPEAVAEHLRKYSSVAKISASGEKQLTILHVSGLRIDVKLNPPDQWGSLLQHYTGSKLHNIHLRNYAKEKGLSLSEYGIKKGSKLQTFKTEPAFYQALGLEYVPPELREDTGEIEAALKHSLPTLVELTDIKGDFHVHTNLPFPTSHDLGASSIAAILTKAESLGYRYLGLSDHNPKQTGLSAAERLAAVKKRNQLIEAAVVEFYDGQRPKIKVLKGLEVDILPSGKLALEDEALEELDYAIVSLHSQFEQSQAVTTKRILAGLAHPKVKILGHPMGRLIGKRTGADADWDAIFEYCAEHHKALEINASPDRLDLPSDLVRVSREKGVKFIINTDAHAAEHLDFMQLGVWVARRGWAVKSDILNTGNQAPF